MGISLSDLSSKVREQVAKKVLSEARNKYGAEKTVVDGIRFDSRREAKRYADLCLLERAGAISNLRRQVDYVLVPSQRKSDGSAERPVKYRADFVYERDGKEIVEDAKGMKTKEYVIKRKLMLYIHGIEVMEV